MALIGLILKPQNDEMSFWILSIYHHKTEVAIVSAPIEPGVLFFKTCFRVGFNWYLAPKKCIFTKICLFLLYLNTQKVVKRIMVYEGGGLFKSIRADTVSVKRFLKTLFQSFIDHCTILTLPRKKCSERVTVLLGRCRDTVAQVNGNPDI